MSAVVESALERAQYSSADCVGSCFGRVQDSFVSGVEPIFAGLKTAVSALVAAKRVLVAQYSEVGVCGDSRVCVGGVGACGGAQDRCGSSGGGGGGGGARVGRSHEGGISGGGVPSALGDAKGSGSAPSRF